MRKSRESIWMLVLLTTIYIFGELGHFLIGVVSRSVAQEIHYGDKGCIPLKDVKDSTVDICDEGEDSESQCHAIVLDTEGNGTKACEWNYTGTGLEYQILAGPSFIAVFTIAGIFWGIAADGRKISRIYLISAATVIFSLAVAATAFVTEYWHLVILRMVLAAGEAGCSPLAAGMISDVFLQNQRGLAMSLFNWGIYIGSGFSFAIGTYVTDANVLDYSWRSSFMLSGIPGLFVALLLLLTVKDPERSDHTLAENGNKDSKINQCTTMHEKSSEKICTDMECDCNVSEIEFNLEIERPTDSAWKLCLDPVIIVLGLAACVRHSAGFCWGYNSALYFQTYYPKHETAWWLTGITIVGGAVGAATGGFFSDLLVNRLGIFSRALVLGTSQFLAAPFAFGVLYLSPPLAFVSLFFGYLLAEMWFGVMFAILVELVPMKIRSTTLGIALFIINNVGGNLPIIVDPLSSLTNFRTALLILYPGALATSSVLFFVCCFLLRNRIVARSANASSK